jgi:hypothetical protein
MMAVIETAEKMLPAGLRPSGGRALRMLAGLLTERGEKAVARRMALTAFSIRIISAALAFVSQIALARLMGEYEYGIFVFVWVLIVVFGDLSCLGFHTAIVRFLPQYKAAGALAEIRGLTGTARIFALLSGTGMLAVGMIALHFFGDRIHSYYVVPDLPRPVRHADDRARRHSGRHVARQPLAGHGAEPGLHHPPRPDHSLHAGRNSPRCAAHGGHRHAGGTRRHLCDDSRPASGDPRASSPPFHAGPRKVDFLGWLGVAFPMFLIEGVSFLLTNSDVVVVGIFLEPHDVAIYFAAAKTMALVHFINFSVKAASGPRFSSIIAGAPAPIWPPPRSMPPDGHSGRRWPSA